MSNAPKSHGRKSISASLKPARPDGGKPAFGQGVAAQVITLLPQAFPGVLGESLTGRALKDGLWQLDTVDLRRFGEGKHRNVDDTPAGGGAGMVLRADVVGRAIERPAPMAPPLHPLLYLSPAAPFRRRRWRATWRQPPAHADLRPVRGLDERVIEHYGIQEVSLGDFVLTGGEIAAQALIDATVRLLPGVLGNADSTEEESFSDGLLEHPQYTRPPEWKGRTIPDVLMSGHHGEIAKWRRAQAKRSPKPAGLTFGQAWPEAPANKSNRPLPDGLFLPTAAHPGSGF